MQLRVPSFLVVCKLRAPVSWESEAGSLSQVLQPVISFQAVHTKLQTLLQQDRLWRHPTAMQLSPHQILTVECLTDH